MAQNQSNMDLVATVAVHFDAGAIEIVSQNGKVASVARVPLIAHGATRVTLIPGEGIAEEELHADYMMRGIQADEEPCVTFSLDHEAPLTGVQFDVYSLLGNGVGDGVLGDIDYHLALYRKRAV